MKNSNINRTASVLLCGIAVLAASSAWAAPKTISLYAKQTFLDPYTGGQATSPGPGMVPMWGFATAPNGNPQFPGPQIDVGPAEYAEGLVVTVYNLLTNLALSEPVSLVIPGLNGSTDVGNPVKFLPTDVNYSNRVQSLVQHVSPGASRTYTWTGPLKVGTYAYHSGSHPALQVQMGLYGMVTVKSADLVPYPGVIVGTRTNLGIVYPLETSVVFSEIDTNLHWAVQNGSYGPGQAISSTIHSDANVFLINGRAATSLSQIPLNQGVRNRQTLFRVANFCWDSRIPTLVGPVPVGNVAAQGSGGRYLTIIAEDANLYPYARTAVAPNVASLKTMDFLFTPPTAGLPPGNLLYRLFDHRLGLSNPSDPNSGGMYANWTLTQN